MPADGEGTECEGCRQRDQVIDQLYRLLDAMVWAADHLRDFRQELSREATAIVHVARRVVRRWHEDRARRNHPTSRWPPWRNDGGAPQ